MASTVVRTAAPQASPAQAPDPVQQLMQFGTGYMPAAALYPVVKLGIPDILANGSSTIASLAVTTKTNEDFLYRIMRALASFGIFAEPEPRTFALTDVSEKLCRNTPGSARDTVLWMTNPFHFQVWSDMEYALR